MLLLTENPLKTLLLKLLISLPLKRLNLLIYLSLKSLILYIQLMEYQTLYRQFNSRMSIGSNGIVQISIGIVSLLKIGKLEQMLKYFLNSFSSPPLSIFLETKAVFF